jgi:hypothetical protein
MATFKNNNVKLKVDGMKAKNKILLKCSETVTAASKKMFG